MSAADGGIATSANANEVQKHKIRNKTVFIKISFTKNILSDITYYNIFYICKGKII